MDFRVCNEGTSPLTIRAVFENVDANRVEMVSEAEWLFPLGCETVPVAFTPLSAEGDLSFKIRVFSPTRELAEHDVMIQLFPETASGGSS